MKAHIRGGGIRKEYRIFNKTFLRKTTKTRQTLPCLFGSVFKFGEYFANTDQEKLFHDIQKLVSNLDPQSTECVYQIISRERESYENGHNAIFNLTQEELDTLKNLQIDFIPHITQLTDDIYQYKGYFLPIKQFEAIFYYKHSLEIFDPKTLEKIKTKDIIDVGGFIGDSAIIFQEFTYKNIHTFEATATNFKHLLKTLELNHTKSIIPVQKALGSTHSTMTIHLYGGGSSLISQRNATQTEEVEIITLDSYIKEHNLEVGFIKVDIEGFELEFLKGAEKTIKEQKPAMLISIYHNPEHFLYIKPMIESWNLGYQFKIYKPIDEYISRECALFCEVLD
ncbi:FkbM family methyltransferase [Helicobacter sp. MIT 05-5293]|uniref:FkbM family methyltransferase n=1 Tax=Helicobacter sp. MIT 05-5293 TaxID=1548149 RepID=UPI0010FCE784|nr:FkbM family methyltransferase [Helicobacter sp. MIT 05-5293]TLD82003.1 FkbM family methyltransferase [Helicobacter sp. MIT 05-5293]